MNPAIFLAVLRHIMQAAAGILLACGTIGPAEADKMTSDAMTAAGAILSLGSLVWMLKTKASSSSANKPSGTLPAILASALLASALLGCSVIAPGSDPVVVNAERTTQLALDVFDTFTRWEFENRTALASVPDIRKSADFVRAKAPDWLKTARSMTKAYKSNRSPENKANVDTAIAVLRAGIVEAQRYLLQPPPTR